MAHSIDAVAALQKFVARINAHDPIGIIVLCGVIAAIRGQWFVAALLIFIMTPVGYGQHVALGMAIRNAERET